ncbi:hypothetical protein FIA58_001675 [Flavobacterium jejuense]|uniref:Glycine zipper domain-containing protein n=1 Tax=Flavobacterium jejuense TaxID=1544455 RepID=A0ABX0IQH4_9FLAO|nr:hypothetical protein [Flavobacterium jejuense]NHN24371.1 hypothetical protein [Flavobacterium jejuense]
MDTLEKSKTTIEKYENAIVTFDKQITTYDFLHLGNNNPYSFTGEMHNKCLDYLIKKVKTPSTKNFINTAGEYYVNNDSGFIKKLDDSFIEKLYILSDSILLEIKKENKVTMKLINHLKANNTIKSELSWILDTLLNFDIITDSFIDKIEQLNQWEFRIINSKYEQNSIIPLLIGSAVARYSLHYWYDSLELSSNSKSARKKNCLRAVFTVAADVIGATGGAVAGFTVGGPVGAAVGGVVMGGAMSGAAYSIFR